MLFEKRGVIAWVTLNRPVQLNAYNMAMRDALFEILSAVHDDADIRAMVLTGAGKAFSTGGDLSEFGSAPSPTIARWVRFRRDVWGRLRALPIPTVAALHGFTVGGGLEMALLCDVAIAADDTRISLPGNRRRHDSGRRRHANRAAPIGFWSRDGSLYNRTLD